MLAGSVIFVAGVAGHRTLHSFPTRRSSDLVAVHVTVVVPMAKVLPEAGVELTVTAPSTISSALAEKVTTGPGALGASGVMLCGPVIAGGVVSRTVTVKLPVALLPWASVAVAFTVVVPSA